MAKIRWHRVVSDSDFLAALDRVRELRPRDEGASRWDITAVLSGLDEYIEPVTHDPGRGLMPGLSASLDRAVLDRARRLIKRGVIAGCDCGCPGFLTRSEDFDNYDDVQTRDVG